MSITLNWLGHASFKLSAMVDNSPITVYIDPWKLAAPQADADIIFISHEHYDHYSEPDIKAISKESTVVYAPASLAERIPGAVGIIPGQAQEDRNVKLSFIPSYNINKDFHPKANLWCGVVVEILGKRVYYAGDTDLIPEMENLGKIDLALLPVGGTYTLNAEEAARACDSIKPAVAMPYHFGDIVGSVNDAELFAQKAQCKTVVLAPGESYTIS